MKKIKNRHVLIAGAAPSLKKYWKQIDNFIKKNNITTIGGNHVNHIFSPDYSFWGSSKRWKKYGGFVNKNSILVLPPIGMDKVVKKHWQGQYIKCDIKKIHLKCCRKAKSIYHCFKNITMVAAFWAYEKGATKISIVGMDGYTFCKKEDLNSKRLSQHCYGKGNTDGFNYNFCRRKDIRYYERLKMLHKCGKEQYGFGLQILTPTIYKKFYNSKVLDIQDTYNIEEPSIEEKKNLGSWAKSKNG